MFGPDFVPDIRSRKRTSGTATSNPASELPKTGVDRYATEPGVDMGYHQVVGTSEMDFLLSVCDSGYFQPVCGGMDGGPTRVRRAGEATD